MNKSWTIRAMVYVGIGLMFLFAVRFSDTFFGRRPEGALPPVNIDRTTEDHLENGRWDSALDDLIPLYDDTSDSNLEAYIALCFKEIAVTAFLDRRYGEAVEKAESGLAYTGNDADLHYILGTARLAQSEYGAAEHAFNKVLELNPANVDAYKQLGEIHYLRNELQNAESAWSRALALGPGDAALEKRLTALRKQLQLNETLDTDDNLHFSVAYDGETMHRFEHTVLDILENAYYDIGGRLQIYPKRLVSVTLLTRQAFFDVTGTPDWTAGLYEGQIKIPVAGADPIGLKTILYHEYTHAVLFDQIGSRCPWWLNEGLAQYLSGDGDGSPGNGVSLPGANRPSDDTTLSALGSVFGLDEEEVARSYALALSGVRYFASSFGEAGIQKIILLMAEGDSFDTAFHTTTGFSFEQFEENWRRYGNS